MSEMVKAFLIEATTGCTCCMDEDHARGPYETREDAERRVAYYLNPESSYCPTGSQFAKRGRYRIREVTIEEISRDRVIVDEYYVFDSKEFSYVMVRPDGTIPLEDKQSDSQAEKVNWPYT